VLGSESWQWAGREIDTSTAMGELLLTLLGEIAQFERANMLERQREGIAKAKAEGKYRGGHPRQDKCCSAAWRPGRPEPAY
jgi:DNA invertase Pin-like site-specific DNA recombinase